MDKSNEIVAVVKALGEVLEKRELDILVQKYEIAELKATIEKLESKLSEKVVPIHKD